MYSLCAGHRLLHPPDLGRYTGLHRCPVGRHQRQLAVANQFAIVVSPHAKRHAALAQPLHPAQHADPRTRWDRYTVFKVNGSPDHHFDGRIDHPLHLTDTNGLNHGDQIARGKAFNQRVGVMLAVRKPGEQ